MPLFFRESGLEMGKEIFDKINFRIAKNHMRWPFAGAIKLFYTNKIAQVRTKSQQQNYCNALELRKLRKIKSYVNTDFKIIRE